MGNRAEALEPPLVVAPVAVPRGLLVALRPRQWITNARVLLVRTAPHDAFVRRLAHAG